MTKPRFPLSVRREFVYRAEIEDTHELIYADSFKTLFRIVHARLRDEVLNRPGDGFECSGATFEFGIETSYEKESNYFYVEWNPLKQFGYMYVSTMTEAFYRFADSRECVMRWRFSNDEL